MWLGTLAEVRRKKKPFGIGTGGGSTPVPDRPFPVHAAEFFAYSADYSGNITATVSQQFLPTDVDVGNNRIALAGQGFNGADGNPKGVRGYFSSTGVLPVGLSAGTPYYRVDSGGFATFYPEATSADGATIPGAFTYETPMPAQNFFQGVNQVVITSQGSGTHTFYTTQLCSRMAGMTAGKDYYVEPKTNPSDKHQWMEVFTDEQSKPYWDSRALIRYNDESSSYVIFGKTWAQNGPGGATSKNAARAEVANKRSVVHNMVIYADPTLRSCFAKCTIRPTGVNTTTGVITYAKTGMKGNAAHGFATGLPIAVRGISGGAAPTEFTGPMFARSVSATTFTIHASASDANAGTNPIIPTTQGTGLFQFYQDSVWGDVERMRFPVEHLDPSSGGNVLTPRFNFTFPTDVTNTIANAFITAAGANNIRFGESGKNTRGGGDLISIDLKFPPGAVPPTRRDTGAVMASDTYYQTLDPGSSAYVRLHETLAQAQECAGLANSAIYQSQAAATAAGFPNRWAICWSVAGSGQCRASSTVRPWSVGIVRGSETATSVVIPLRQKFVYSIHEDYDDPSSATIRERHYINGVKVLDFLRAGAKGVTGAVLADGSPAWSQWNSADGHVPWEGRTYGGQKLASTGEILEADIIAAQVQAMAYYGIA